MQVPPPKILALELKTPSVETKYCEADVDEVSASEIWKFCMKDTFAFANGTPPLSTNNTLNFCDNVFANGQPAVPPPTII